MENEKREGEQECGKNIDGICFIMSHSIVVTRKKMIAYNWLDGLISKAVYIENQLFISHIFDKGNIKSKHIRHIPMET